MRILNVLPTGGMGWSGGIRPTLCGLADSWLGARHTFSAIGVSELSKCLQDIHPDLIVWHGASSWRELLRFQAHRRHRQILVEHHYCAGFERHNVPSILRFRTMLRLCYSAMEKVVAVSAAQRRWMQEARLVAPCRVDLLLSSRPLDPFLSLASPPATASRPLTLLAYGRWTPQKGFDRLLRAVRLLSAAPLRLLVAGDGPQAAELIALADGDPRIELLGSCNNITALMAQVDAVVIPSRWEPWGNVCLEARAAGRPVLVSDVDGLPEQVQGSGLVISGESDHALAASLDSLLTATAAQRRCWGLAGRVSAAGSWECYLNDWYHLLELDV